MNFKINEIKVSSKNKSNKFCEDRIIFNEDFVCVIDGATTKSDFLFENKTSGLIVGEILEKAFNNLKSKSSITEIITKFTNSIREFYINNNFFEQMQSNPIDRLTASIVIYSKYYNQIWFIGDCQCMVDNKIYSNEKPIDKLLSETRSLYIQKELDDGKTIKELQNHDTGREYILPLLKSQYYFQNNNFENEYSYCVLDGFKINLNFTKTVKINKGKTIILASDGYPKLFNSLEKSEEYLKYILENDPLCYKLFKSTKGLYENLSSYDDRAYVKFEINYS